MLPIFSGIVIAFAFESDTAVSSECSALYPVSSLFRCRDWPPKVVTDAWVLFTADVLRDHLEVKRKSEAIFFDSRIDEPVREEVNMSFVK